MSNLKTMLLAAALFAATTSLSAREQTVKAISCDSEESIVKLYLDFKDGTGPGYPPSDCFEAHGTIENNLAIPPNKLFLFNLRDDTPAEIQGLCFYQKKNPSKCWWTLPAFTTAAKENFSGAYGKPSAPARTVTPTPPPAQTTAPVQTQIAVKVYDLKHSASLLTPGATEAEKRDWLDASWVGTKNTNLTKYTLQYNMTCTAYDSAGHVLGTGNDDDRSAEYKSCRQPGQTSAAWGNGVSSDCIR